MVKINTLLEEKKISIINELEIARYVNFFENSYQNTEEEEKPNDRAI